MEIENDRLSGIINGHFLIIWGTRILFQDNIKLYIKLKPVTAEGSYSMTVKIYKITCTSAYQMSETGERFSLSPWGKDTDYYKGYDDEGEEYILPEGYEFALSEHEQPNIYFGKDWINLVSYNGRPALQHYTKTIPLKRA